MSDTLCKSAVSSTLSANINGLIGVIIFSGSLPATRMAVLDMSPLFLTFMRGSIAGLLALLLLLVCREKRPHISQLFSVLTVAVGVVIGFPLLTALALQHISSVHSIVFLGLLPLSTAIFGVIRGGERMRPAFWGFSLLGSMLVTVFALLNTDTVSPSGDLLMLAAIIVCGLGYAEGARLSRTLGGWQVICWALVVALPFMLVGACLVQPQTFSDIHFRAWCALGYVSLFSMLIGFFFWYKGLVQGGIAAVGQLQLLQPFFSLGLAAWLLHETISPLMLVATLGVVICVAGSRKYSG